ncbi:HAD family hydrolase [Stutzerimonas nitrititolerans]|uniref:Uncharacterized protein n=1 Tax=Stutzerimonas nitrititolerans TaxID=2482751 RepID=A0AA41WLY6_9GAMM|nr:HAD family hydrolase [Stutzerimonas nitrititolerans]MCO7546962.1 hypothetical protein [Stutzerimonas nitrititolerans]
MRIGLDLDGTLVSCYERQMTLLGLLARACRLELDIQDCWALKREGLGNRAALVRLGIAPGQAEAAATLWEQAIEDFHWLAYDRLLPGVPDMLRRWRVARHSLHLVSARRNPVCAAMQLRRLGLDGFASVDFVDPFAADGKRQALERIRPDVYIGDTERDFLCAREAGVVPLLLCSGLRSRAYLERTCDASVVDDLAQVGLPLHRALKPGELSR